MTHGWARRTVSATQKKMVHPRILSAWSLALLLESSLGRRDGRGGAAQGTFTSQACDSMDPVISKATRLLAGSQGSTNGSAQSGGPQGCKAEAERAGSSEQAECVSRGEKDSAQQQSRRRAVPGAEWVSGSELVGVPSALSSSKRAGSWRRTRCCRHAIFLRMIPRRFRAGAGWKARLVLVRLGAGLIGPNAGLTGELELGAGSWGSLRGLMTAGCHRNRASQGSFRMLCDGAPTNLEAKVVQVKFLPGGRWDDGTVGCGW